MVQPPFASEEAEAGESQVTDEGRTCCAWVSEWPERGCTQSPGSRCSLQTVPLPQAQGVRSKVHGQVVREHSHGVCEASSQGVVKGT